jgi:hypothetical protein
MTSGETLSLVLTAVNILGTIALAVLGQAMNARQRQDAQRLAKMDTLETDLKRATVHAIDEKLGTLRAMNDERFAQVWKRFEIGEARFDRLEQRDQKIELMIERRLSEIQSDVAVIKSHLGIESK